MGLLHRFGNKVKAFGKFVLGHKAKIGAVAGGLAMLGSKAQAVGEKASGLADKAVEVQKDVREAEAVKDNVTAIVKSDASKLQKAKAVKAEVKEAKQYRETRVKAKADGRAVPDARPVYQQQAKVAGDTQRMLRNQVSMAGKGKCYQDAEKRKKKKARQKAKRACDAKFG
jgi:hypothetical protein